MVLLVVRPPRFSGSSRCNVVFAEEQSFSCHPTIEDIHLVATQLQWSQCGSGDLHCDDRPFDEQD